MFTYKKSFGSILIFLTLLLALFFTGESLCALDYYTIPSPSENDKSILYAPSIKNHFLIKEDIKDPTTLTLRLLRPQIPLSQLIASSLSKSTITYLNNYKPVNNNEKDTKELNTLKEMLVKDLNKIIAENDLFSKSDILDSTKISDTTISLIQEYEATKNTSQRQKVMLNRMILNDAYDEIAGWKKDSDPMLLLKWSRTINKGELPYKYLKGLHVYPIKKQSNVSLNINYKNSVNDFSLNTISTIYTRDDKSSFTIENDTIENDSLKLQKNSNLTLYSKGNKVSNRFHLSMKITGNVSNDNERLEIYSNIHFTINPKDGIITNRSFVGFARSIHENTAQSQFILLKGKITGPINNAEIKGLLKDIDRNTLGSFQANINLMQLIQ